MRPGILLSTFPAVTLSKMFTDEETEAWKIIHEFKLALAFAVLQGFLRTAVLCLVLKLGQRRGTGVCHVVCMC